MVLRRTSVAGFAVLALSLPAHAQTGAVCDSCHEQSRKLAASAHAQVQCETCHPGHGRYPHPARTGIAACASCHAQVAADYAHSVHARAVEQGSKTAPRCATCHSAAHQIVSAKSDEFRASVPGLCGRCHPKIASEYRTSVHGKARAQGAAQAPVCTDCHGEHRIEPKRAPGSLVNAARIRDACGGCHGNVSLTRRFGLPGDRLTSFDASFHGLAARAGLQTAANCASCHGVHNILASTDPASTISVSNLPVTCGRCHPGAGERFALGPIHAVPGRTDSLLVRWVRSGYVVLIPLVVGLMLIHNAGDWFRKFRLRRVYGHPPASTWYHPATAPVRMLPFERLLHLLLTLSFVVLAFTGFQLKYPDQWWARPSLALEASLSLRGIVHRVAAVVFLSTAVLHVLAIIRSGSMRQHWKKLRPEKSDVYDGIESLLYSIGIRTHPPQLPAYHFAAKIEYWGVVWGCGVMAVTGLMLWANNLSLRFLPKQALDVATAIHFYEAVLASLSLAVWHFYFVMYDPDVYPGDPAWVTGKTVRIHELEPEPEEAGRFRWQSGDY